MKDEDIWCYWQLQGGSVIIIILLKRKDLMGHDGAESYTKMADTASAIYLCNRWIIEGFFETYSEPTHLAKNDALDALGLAALVD